MPELPEVESIRRQLEPLIVGKTVVGVEVFNQKSFLGDKKKFIGKEIVGVGRKGKVLIVCLADKDDKEHKEKERLEKDAEKKLLIHLKMSGQLRYRYFKISISSPFDNRHLRVVIKFSNGDCLEFHDQRKFGWITDNPAVLPKGVDALDMELTASRLTEILQSSNRPVKMILLDQSKIAGIGNIYASEILWEAGISPWARFKEEGRGKKEEGEANKLVKFRELHNAIRKILNEAIESGGSTMNDGLYRQVGGESGNYWSRRRVYDRENEPCLRCKTPVKKGVIGQRPTYWCPECQLIIKA